MHPFLAYAQSKQSSIIALIREFVECESPSDDRASVDRFVHLLVSKLDNFTKVRTPAGGRFGHHLNCEFSFGRKPRDGDILVLAHSDTVWPLGTLKQMPFRRKDGRLWGPGVLDMKSGIAFFLFAIRMLRELDVPVTRRVVLQVNSDEEVGSETSRPLTEEAARSSAVVLVLEPGTGLTGKIKTARKGVGDYTVTVKGRASHAGVDFQNGASAIVELARQIERISRFTNVDKGITVNPGVIAGGTRTNVVAAEARAEVDIRVARMKDDQGIEKKFDGLRSLDKRCTIKV
jgi:glutamate carboxypeptidase